MNNKIVAISIVLLALLSSAGSGEAAVVAMGDAETIAENWISLVIHHEGSWGGSPEAHICSIEPFVNEVRQLGYICHVSPRGHIIISLLEGLAPVKSYSETASLTPELDEGLPEVIKYKMGRLLGAVEERLGPIETIATEELLQVLEFDFSDDWDFLLRDPELVKRELRSGVSPLSYAPGTALLTSNWHQGAPYNHNCPWGMNGCEEPNCAVGCAPLAGSQIMDYWEWPPYTPGGGYRYDWPNIPDTVTTLSPQVEIDATALLCYEVGDELDVTYCAGGKTSCATAGFTYEMEDIYPSFDYHTNAEFAPRSFHWEQDDWWALMVGQIDNEQPCHYAIIGHSIVMDGYKTIGSVRLYHMNYGWAGSCSDDKPCCDGITDSNTWYTLDSMPCSEDYEHEYMIIHIYPVNRLRGPLTGTYDPPVFTIPYRYLSNGSYIAVGADFWGGQSLQFQKNFVTLTCPESATSPVRFYGNGDLPDGSIRVYNRGDYQRGFRVHDGALAIYAGGGFLLK